MLEKKRLTDVFKTVGLHSYTYVKPAHYGEVLKARRIFTDIVNILKNRAVLPLLEKLDAPVGDV